MENYHITKDGKKWSLKKEGSTRPSLTSETKQDIIDQTIKFMKDKTGSVKIHKENGKIQEERTYHRGDDPRKSKG